ncbi:MBL fold metallo-hydrolase [Candidatus Roizmanbacteria bacterium]|nr:MBL fold metallo-hydrolase [Candidatus Roizmanbacteria bacterium]
MKIVKYSLGQLQANCYFLIEGSDCLIIDPADEASFILEELQRRNLKLIGILATHGHFDHIMAIGEIQLSFSIPLIINKKDQFLIDRLSETAEHFLGFKQSIVKPKNIESTISRQLVNTYGLQIIETPGHTPGSRCFYFKKEKVLFTGDTLFNGTIGRFDHSYCNKDDLRNSLIELTDLPEEVIIYPGHGEKTVIEDEKNNLPIFLQYLE